MRMSCLWMCLSLFCFALLQSSASLHAMLLSCNETVEVEAGEDVTLICAIRYQNISPSDIDGCNVLCTNVSWNNTSGNLPRDSGSTKYSCESDQKKYVFLTISNVMTEENYTIDVITDCDMAKSSPIKVQVKRIISSKMVVPTQEPQKNITTITTIIFVICITIIVVGVFYFMFGTNYGRKIRKLIMGDHSASKEDAEDPLTTDI